MTKVLLKMVAVAGLSLALILPVSAADEKTKTITGEGKCTKCAMNESKTCQNAVEVTEGGKKVTYYIAQNDISKKFHSEICKEPQKVTVTGTVKKVNGKLELTPSKMEVANK